MPVTLIKMSFIKTRCILYKSAEDFFVADIMYHKLRMEAYLLSLKRNVEAFVNFREKKKNLDMKHLQVAIKDVLSSLDLETRCHAYLIFETCWTKDFKSTTLASDSFLVRLLLLNWMHFKLFTCSPFVLPH